MKKKDNHAAKPEGTEPNPRKVSVRTIKQPKPPVSGPPITGTPPPAEPQGE